jgi:hypothetical protein
MSDVVFWNVYLLVVHPFALVASKRGPSVVCAFASGANSTTTNVRTGDY